MFEKTNKLENLIKANNKGVPLDHLKKIKMIKKNKDLINFIDNKQRKYYSNTQAQNEELSNLKGGQ